MRNPKLNFFTSSASLQPGGVTSSDLLEGQGFHRRLFAQNKDRANALLIFRDINAMLRRAAKRITREYPRIEIHEAESFMLQLMLDTARLSLFTKSTQLGKIPHECKEHFWDTLRHYVRMANDGSRVARQILDETPALMEEIGFILVEDTAYVRVDETYLCSVCEERGLEDAAVTVYTGTDIDDDDNYYLAHSGCVDPNNGIEQCSISGLYFDTEATGEDLECLGHDRDGDGVWESYCLANNLIHEEEVEDDDGDLCTRLFRGIVRVAPGSATTLAGYHHAPRPWTTQSTPIPQGHIGVELELGFDNTVDFRKFLASHVLANGRFKDGRPFSCERDGSLDGIPNGMEIISDPLPLHSGYQADNSAWRWLLKTLYEGGASGWKYRTKAGIHVNQCVRGRTDEHILKYAAFISNARALSCFVSGRKAIYGAQNTSRGGYKEMPVKLLRMGISNALDNIFNNGKYSPVSRRDAFCLETRVFGSNIRYEGFMACVEYCEAAMLYVEDKDVWDIMSPIAPAQFRNWLASISRRFPNLSARLGVIPHAHGVAVPSTSKVTPVLLAA